MHVRSTTASACNHTCQKHKACGLIRISTLLGCDEAIRLAVDMAVLQQHLPIPKDEIYTSLNVTVSEVVPAVVQISSILPSQKPTVIECTDLQLL